MTGERLSAAVLARHLDAWHDAGGAGYSALAARIRALLLDGRLAVGTRVPSERALALTLALGRGTVAAAYEELCASGHLVRRRGSGTWTTLPAVAGRGPVTPFAPMSALSVPPTTIDFAHAAPEAPAEAVTAAGHEALEALPAHLSGPGYDLLGLPVLREGVAGRLTAQGLPTTPDEVMITAGAQHAHALVVRALVRPGDRVLLEQPTYPNAIDLVRHASARGVPVTLDATAGGVGGDGWDVGVLAAALRESTPALAYLVPDHQNPTGAVMSASTREAVVAATRRHGVPLVIDDCLREMWLDAPPPPPVGAWAASSAGSGDHAPVLTLGSLSKTVWGGLRIGWLRAPRAVLRRVAAARASDDIATPVLEQLLATALLARLDDLLPARRACFAVRRDHLVAALGRALPEWRAPRPSGGLSLWVALRAPQSSALVESAARHGVRVAAGPRFGTGGAFEGFLRLPYTQAPDVLDDAVARLAAAWRALESRGAGLTTVV